jgi:large subunit ribosomal protein L21
VLDVDRLDVAEGSTVELDRVLVVGEGDKISVGTPTVEGAKVVATSKGDGRGEKIIVFKYKPKVRYRRKTGHRQGYTRLAIDEIVAPGIAPGKPARKRTRRKKEEGDSGA